MGLPLHLWSSSPKHTIPVKSQGRGKHQTNFNREEFQKISAQSFSRLSRASKTSLRNCRSHGDTRMKCYAHPGLKRKHLVKTRTSVMVRGLRILLPMQETRVRSPVWEDSTCGGATKPRIAAVERLLQSRGAETMEPTGSDGCSLHPLEPVLCKERGLQATARAKPTQQLRKTRKKAQCSQK